MAFDGIVVANLVSELSNTLTNGRILKISQPEKDELILTIKNYKQYKLFLSAGAGLPLVYLTENNKPSPLTAPNFCMLLRKYLNSARILRITQPGLERIIQIEIEHLDELSDLCTKYLIIEIMGKHSNIIFCDNNFKIIDSIKHISGFVSSVREVLPGRDYFIPKTMEKYDPLTISFCDFQNHLSKKPMALSKAIYMTLTGFSPLLANELCYQASLDPEISAKEVTPDLYRHLYRIFETWIEKIKTADFVPNILYKEKEPIEFSCFPLTSFLISSEYKAKTFDQVSVLLETYFSEKNSLTRIRQKSSDLRRIVSTAMERNSKKYNLQLNQLKDTEKKEKYRIYGELLTTYGYEAKEGDTSLTVLNYYTNEELTIPLDPLLSAMENAKQYFERYGKLKRTQEALSKFILETKEELEHLDSIRTSLDIALQETDLVELKEELIQYGYMKRHLLKTQGNKSKKAVKKEKVKSKPFHYLSKDGFHLYVGKNNFQNDELTFHFASGNDWWFHAKGIPGSHVLLKLTGDEPTDRTFEEAASLAAFYSKGRDSEKVEIDYIQKKHVKKPSGGKPGFVIYHTNYSMIATPDLSGLTLFHE